MAYRVLLLNGSPHARGCTDRALQEVAKVLQEERDHFTSFPDGKEAGR